MKIYIGNLSFETTEQDIRKEFEAFGAVDSVSIAKDRDSGRPRGFAFVEMPTVSEGQNAIKGLNDKSIDERTIVVNEAKPRNDNRSGGYRGGGSSRGGGRQQRY